MRPLLGSARPRVKDCFGSQAVCLRTERDRSWSLLRLHLPVREAQDHRADAARVVGRRSGRRSGGRQLGLSLHAQERGEQFVDRRMGRPVAIEPPHVPERQLADGVEGPSGDGADPAVDGVEVEAAPCAACASPGSAPGR